MQGIYNSDLGQNIFGQRKLFSGMGRALALYEGPGQCCRVMLRFQTSTFDARCQTFSVANVLERENGRKRFRLAPSAFAFGR